MALGSLMFFIIAHIKKKLDKVLYLLIGTVYLDNGRVTELYMEEPTQTAPTVLLSVRP